MIDYETNKKILVTGGSGFIGGALIRKLLFEFPRLKVFNIDKLGYASDIASNNYLLNHPRFSKNYKFFNINLKNAKDLENIIEDISPNIIFNLAAESHVDRSIDRPGDFIESNVIGTFNLLNYSLKYWQNLPSSEKDNFRFLHISTDEVFGSLRKEDPKFNEFTPYNPKSPYAASKASSDHLVKVWYYTYGFPSLITNCSNNFGPRQFPEKLVPLVIKKAISNKEIPMYGDGSNIRDWLFIDDHIEALLLVISKGLVGETYCIGGYGENTNLDVIKSICKILQVLKPRDKDIPYEDLIVSVPDRLGHDFRYAINSSKISKELGWIPKYKFCEALEITVKWYLDNTDWLKQISENSGYGGERLGVNNYFFKM